MTTSVYTDYKYSGVEWIGDIPHHWDVWKVSQAFNRIGSGTTPPTNESQWYESEEIPWVTTGELRENIITKTNKFVTKEAISRFSALSIHPTGALAVAMYGATIGRMGIFGIDAATNQACCVLSEPIHIKIKLLFYWLQAFKKIIIDLYATGGGQPNISQEILAGLKVPVPDLNEQDKIISFLDHEVAKIDSLMAEQEILVNLLKVKLDALVLSSFALSDTTTSRLKHIVDVIKRPVEQQDCLMYEPLGLLNRGRGLFHKESREKADMGDSDFYWIKEGDLILSGQFAWEGAVALAYGEEEGCVVSHRYPVIRGKTGVVLTEYLYALFTTAHGDFLLNECSVGAAGRNRPLNINLLLKEIIHIPNFEIQQKIKKIVAQRKNLLSEIEKQRSLLNERRSALITAAVTGQIDVRNYQFKEVA